MTGWRGRQASLLESRHNHPRVSSSVYLPAPFNRPTRAQSSSKSSSSVHWRNQIIVVGSCTLPCTTLSLLTAESVCSSVFLSAFVRNVFAFLICQRASRERESPSLSVFRPTITQIRASKLRWGASGQADKQVGRARHRHHRLMLYSNIAERKGEREEGERRASSCLWPGISRNL